MFYSFERDNIMSNLDATITYDHFGSCDMVVEAVFEDINIKHKVIKEIEPVSSQPLSFHPHSHAIFELSARFVLLTDL